jgi:FixJ family two-component response regulator
MIYLVDDDHSVSYGFGMFLESAGMETRAFESAEDFLRDARLQSGDILVLDMHLPGMSGCELLHKLFDAEIIIPVIVVTAFDEQQSREACKEYEVTAFLRKPVDGEALLDLITYSLLMMTPANKNTNATEYKNIN